MKANTINSPTAITTFDDNLIWINRRISFNSCPVSIIIRKGVSWTTDNGRDNIFRLIKEADRLPILHHIERFI